jgi:Lar family restriction alleviation protein
MSGMKPCPFCGKEDLYFEVDEEGETNIVCDWCEYKTRIFQTIGDAARWWNTRPIEDALRKRIAELETESERFTVHSDIERQDDKSPNDTQTQTIVYGKEREE